MRMFKLIGIMLLVLTWGRMALATNRFPKPQFESGYTPPEMTTPAARAMSLEYLDVALLLVALGLTAYFLFQRRSRRLVLLTAAVSLVYFGFYRKGCVCAVGALQNVALALVDPTYTIPLTALIFFVAPLVVALFFGRVFCGAVCPLGCMQDLVALKPSAIPRWAANILGLIPYVYLGLAVLFTAAGERFIICRMDPFVGFFRLSATPAMLVFGALFILAGVFVARPYCRFMCPYGVLLGWMAFFSRRRVSVTPGECISCRLCENACPFDAIEPSNSEGRSQSAHGRMRRFLVTLCLAPLLLGAFGWLGGQLDGVLAQVHPRVALAKLIRAEEDSRVVDTSEETRSFRGTGVTIPELYEEESLVRARFHKGSYLLGGFIGLVFVVRLLAQCIRRYHPDYTVNRMHCYSCARCYAYCPQEPVNRVKEIDHAEA